MQDEAGYIFRKAPVIYVHYGIMFHVEHITGIARPTLSNFKKYLHRASV